MLKFPQLRVLHIITRLVAGGADENTIRSVEGMHDPGIEIDLVVGGLSEQEQIDKISNGRVIVMSRLVRNISPLNDLLAFISLVRLIRKERYHIVHTHTAKAGIIGRLAARWCHVPLIIHTLHGSTFHANLHVLVRHVYRFLERIMVKFTDKMISVGCDLRDRYLLAGVGYPDQYVVIRSGFELNKFLINDEQIARNRARILNELGLDDCFLLGTATRLEKRKGINFLIDAIEQVKLKFPNVKLLVAGAGEMQQEFQEYAQSKDLAEHIIFTGFRQDIVEFLSALDVFLLTSLWEGLPRVLVQAAVLAKPIITFDIEGANELVINGKNGYIVPIRDVNAFAEKICFFLENQQHAKKMGKNGTELVDNSWNSEYMVEQIRLLYLDMWAAKTRIESANIGMK